MVASPLPSPSPYVGGSVEFYRERGEPRFKIRIRGSLGVASICAGPISLATAEFLHAELGDAINRAKAQS